MIQNWKLLVSVANIASKYRLNTHFQYSDDWAFSQLFYIQFNFTFFFSSFFFLPEHDVSITVGYFRFSMRKLCGFSDYSQLFDSNK